MISCLSAVISLIVVALVVDFWKRWNRGWKYLRHLPGPSKTLPIFGDMLYLIGQRTKPAALLKEARDKLGPTYRFWMKDEPLLVTSELSLVKKVLSSPIHVDKASQYLRVGKITAKYSLVGSPAPVWRHDRKRFLPAFQKDSLDLALQHSNTEAKVLLKKLAQNESQEIDLMKIMCTCVLNIFIRTMMELSEEDLTKFSDKLSDIIERFKYLAGILFLQPWARASILWYLFGYEDIQKRVKQDLLNLIKDFDSVIKANEMLASKEGNSKINIRSLAVILFDPEEPLEWRSDQIMSAALAGMDTTALSICWTLFFLAVNPECLALALEEVDTVFSESDEDCEVTYNHLTQLKYIEMCWKEAMRLRPPGPFIGRNLSENIVLDDGRTIPAGLDVFIDIGQVHLDPSNFPDPEVFKPERFTEEVKPYSYLPFSMGPRNCIGQKFGTTESKTVLAQILRKYTVTTPQKPEDIEVIIQVTGEPVPGLDIRFHPRAKTNNNDKSSSQTYVQLQ